MTTEKNDGSTANLLDETLNTGLGEITPLLPEPNLENLISQIDVLSRPINDFWIKHDSGGPRRKLPPEEEARFNKLIQPRNQRIIDLLIARNTNDWSNVLVILNKGIQGIDGFKEETHPFSDNNVTIYAPSSRNLNSDFTIKVKLSGLRRKGLADNSLDVEALLGEKTEAPETPKNFMFRTQRELAQIRELRNHGHEQTKDPQTIRTIDYLNQLTADITIGRLVELKRRGKIPESFEVFFYSSTDEKTQKPNETTVIRLLNGGVRNFVIPGQRIGAALVSFGFNYDTM